MTVTLRPATPADADAIAGIWYHGWRDGHTGCVPDSLLPHRRPEHFRQRVPQRLPSTTVATVDGRVAGFVTLRDDEVEQFYVADYARGTGVAAALMRHAEAALSTRYAVVWLGVVEQNARARRFYEKCGWSDAGPFDYQAEIPGGTIPVPCRRYEKRLTGSTPATH
jgi:ribosomal protein S18 acetylase RimI-like enzyme